MNKSRTALASKLSLLLLVVACGLPAPGQDPKQLTRERARVLIEASPQFQKPLMASFIISPTKRSTDRGNMWEHGVQAGMWSGPADVWESKAAFTLTEAGNRLFKVSHVNRVWRTAQLDVQEGVPREIVEITGIADIPIADELKEVQFTWKFRDIPDVVREYVEGDWERTYDGKAALRLYDDGWRIEDKLSGPLL